MRLGAYLDLFPLEDGADARVKGGSREHGGHRVGQVQDLLEDRGHILETNNNNSINRSIL